MDVWCAVTLGEAKQCRRMRIGLWIRQIATSLSSDLWSKAF